MKKTVLLSLMIGLIFQTYLLRAEESPAPSTPASPEPVTTASVAPIETAPMVSPTAPEPSPTPAAITVESPTVPVTENAPIPAAPPVATAASSTNTSLALPAANPEPVASEKLEFVSGEITSTDETAKTVTVKLYGETENATNDKILTVKLDETTDITDGEKDRDIKSLINGTEVDVEYDPATNKATYIFVY